jgi:hypothetical protein
MHQVSKRSLAALGVVLCLALPPALACSSTQQGAVCGVGTKLVNGACVPDFGGDAAGGDATASDASEPDGGANADGSAEEDAGVDDPCPTPLPTFFAEGITTQLPNSWVVNCDPRCGAVAKGVCERARCMPQGKVREFYACGGGVGGAGSAGGGRATFRLPRDPWLLGGPCDPSTSLRYPDPSAGGVTVKAHTAMNPQPRFIYSWGLPFSPTDAISLPVAISGGRWTLRPLNMRNVSPTNERTGLGCRNEPLVRADETFTEVEREFVGCKEFRILDFDSVWPPGTPLSGPGPGGGSPVVIAAYTSASHIPATNFEIRWGLPDGVCGGDK